MSLPLDRMRALLRKGLGGLDEQDLPDTEADELLNMSLWELESRFDFKEKECLIQTPIVGGTYEYLLPNSVDAIITVSVHRTTLPHERFKLKKRGYDTEAERVDSVNDPDKRGMPLTYFRRNRTLVLDPVPFASGWTLEILTWKSVESLIDDPTATVGLPRNWHELVVEGAVVRGHFYNEDYNIAQQASNFQNSKIRSAVSTNTKEDRDNRFAGVKVQHDHPDDIKPRR
jgi:hypothetical protein